jgi:hypothetical protein
MDAKRNDISASADAVAGRALNIPAKSINAIRVLPVKEKVLFAIFTLPGYIANLLEDRRTGPFLFTRRNYRKNGTNLISVTTLLTHPGIQGIYTDWI